MRVPPFRACFVDEREAMDPNNILAPWGDAYQTPCSCGGNPVSAWIQANPWLALAIAAGALYVVSHGGKP